MLFAKGELRYGPTLIRLHVALLRRLEIQTTERRASTFDTRFAPPRGAGGRARHILHVYLDGDIEVRGLPKLTAPFAMLSTEAQYYGGAGEKPVPLRASGEPYLKIEIRVPAEDVLVAAPYAPVLLDAAPSFFEAALAYVETVGWGDTDASVRDAAVKTLLMSLVRAGWLGAPTFSGATDEESPALSRLWNALTPSISVIDLNATLGVFSRRSGITARHLARNVDALLTRIHSPLSFRAFVAEHRLRVALLLLSAPHAKLDEVAELAGYASGESLAAALRDASLPPPGQLRRFMEVPL